MDEKQIMAGQNKLRPQDVFLQLRFCPQTHRFGSSSCSESQLLLSEPRDCALPAASVTIVVNEKVEFRHDNGSVFSMTLRADGGIAVWVLLESSYIGTFSDNLFFLLPWVPKEVEFISQQHASDPDAFYKSLTVTWLQGKTERRNSLVLGEHGHRNWSRTCVDDLFLTKAAVASF
jgi:hypothetical protein